MEFVKNGKGFDILVNNQIVGKMFKDESKNYMFQYTAKLNIEIQGYRNEARSKSWKQLKKDVEILYNNLLTIRERLASK